MRFMATADTDKGIVRDTNQDSLMIKHGQYAGGEIVLAAVCDGMGGLSKGELASATVIREFSRWFCEELPYELENLDLQVVGEKWSLLLHELNHRIFAYGQQRHLTMGTTFTGILIVHDKYVIAHVGDTRVYHIGSTLRQLTEDQTYVSREIKRGRMTAEQAKTDKRRNMLLQCVGASQQLEPEIICGTCEKGAYLICSDGFRHEITESEIYGSLNPVNFNSRETMHSNAKYLIELVKQRREKDNISLILIKAD